MMEKINFDEILKNHVTPYVYNNEFKKGVTPIYYSGPYWDKKEIEAAIDTFLYGKWLTSGEKVMEFEMSFSYKFNVRKSKMVNSGSSANLILINGLKNKYKWKDDDEIIVSPVGFPTTISVIYQNRLKPVFVDIELNTLNFDVNKIEEKITHKTRGIFVSPVLGNPPDMDKLNEIATKYNLLLIGDNCDSLGTKWDNKFLHENYIAFSNSFYPAHHLCTGEGGMVCTNDFELDRIFNQLCWWGRDCHCVGAQNLTPFGSCGSRFNKWLDNYDGIIDHKYVFNQMGYNLKPLDLQGAIGIEQVKKFDEIDKNRKRSKKIITEIFLSNIDYLRSPETHDKADVCWFGTPFICEEDKLKNDIVWYLERKKIQTRNYFAGNILLHEGYKFLDDYKKYPNANKILDNVFFVGASPHYNENVFNYIEEIVKSYKK